MSPYCKEILMAFTKKLHCRMICGILFLFLFLLFISSHICEAQSSRFFLMGDCKIHIRNDKTGKEARVNLLTPAGDLNEAAFDSIDVVFNFTSKNKGEHISPRLIFMLDYFSDLVAPGKAIILESGYRSPEYNSSIRNRGANAAKTSTHMDGLALDFRIDGVDGKRLWQTIKSYGCCGVGHYGGQIVHLDSARPRFWEASTSKVHTGESDYNRRMYLSTDFDRYKTGETVMLSFSSVSDFGFGIKRTVVITDNTDKENSAATAIIKNQGDADCIVLNNRDASRFLYLTLPAGIKAGRYKIKVDFCERPFEQMPVKILSNEIEITLN